MPRYVYNCPACGQFERILSLANHSSHVSCECGGLAKQVITVPTVVIPSHMSATGVSAYESPTTGNIITNMRERRNDLAASNCIEYDPGMKQDADRRAAEQAKALDKSVDDTVEEVFATMPSEKLERLTNELEAGADIELARI